LKNRKNEGKYMALQPAQLNGEQAQAIYALVNMEQAVQAADGRVQRATDETLKKMQEALNQSEANNQTLAERIAQMTRDNSTLKQQIKELTDKAAAQKQAQEAYSKADQERVHALVMIANTECEETKKLLQEKIAKEKPDTRDCSPFKRGIIMEKSNLDISDSNKILDRVKSIQSQISKLEKP
jgi:predicted RNase H-like nuclease (RuvC/YqgF family)